MNEQNPEPGAHANPFGELIGLRFERWASGESICALDLTPQMLNPNGVAHGAVMYALADTGMGGALMSALDGGRYCTTVEIKIAYFRPAISGRLVCESRVVHQGKRIAFLESTVVGDDGPVARASGTFAILEPRRAADR